MQMNNNRIAIFACLLLAALPVRGVTTAGESSTAAAAGSSAAPAPALPSSSSAVAEPQPVANCSAAPLFDCTFPQGNCRLGPVGPNGTRESVCACENGFGGADCSIEEREDSPYSNWSVVVWGIIGVVVGMLCLDRLWSSCKKAYARRQGRDREGFAPVSSLTGDDVSNAELTDIATGATSHAGSAGARTDNDSL